MGTHAHMQLTRYRSTIKNSQKLLASSVLFLTVNLALGNLNSAALRYAAINLCPYNVTSLSEFSDRAINETRGRVFAGYGNNTECPSSFTPTRQTIVVDPFELAQEPATLSANFVLSFFRAASVSQVFVQFSIEDNQNQTIVPLTSLMLQPTEPLSRRMNAVPKPQLDGDRVPPQPLKWRAPPPPPPRPRPSPSPRPRPSPPPPASHTPGTSRRRVASTSRRRAASNGATSKKSSSLRKPRNTYRHHYSPAFLDERYPYGWHGTYYGYSGVYGAVGMPMWIMHPYYQYHYGYPYDLHHYQSIAHEQSTTDGSSSSGCSSQWCEVKSESEITRDDLSSRAFALTARQAPLHITFHKVAVVSTDGAAHKGSTQLLLMTLSELEAEGDDESTCDSQCQNILVGLAVTAGGVLIILVAVVLTRRCCTKQGCALPSCAGLVAAMRKGCRQTETAEHSCGCAWRGCLPCACPSCTGGGSRSVDSDSSMDPVQAYPGMIPTSNLVTANQVADIEAAKTGEGQRPMVEINIHKKDLEV